jgi:apolipoprotein N-acyltransferase
MDRIAGTVARLKGWPRVGVATAAGGVSALALAPFNVFPLLWATIPVFIWLIDGAARGDGRGGGRVVVAGAAVGWCFGFGYFLGGLWWIGAAFLVDADQFAWLMPIAVVILPAGLALFWGLGAAVAALFWRSGWSRVVIFAGALAVAEWLRGHVLTGFPWNAFGYALTPSPVMMQSAAVVGLWGLTLAALIIFAAPAALIPSIPTAERGARAFALFGAALFAAHLGFGAVRLAGAEDSGGGPTVRIVQPALDQSEKWQVENPDEIVVRYLELSRAASETRPDLDGVTVLVWPESAFPFLLADRPDVLSAIADLLPDGTTLITGAVRADERAHDSLDAFNSVLVIDDQGTVAAAYDKVHLVPFGEYLPLRRLFDRLGIRQLIAIPEGFSAGATRLTLTLPGTPPFAPLICYEIIFPGAVLATGLRPGWILNLTNDTWFGETPGPYQHFLQGRVRAVEEGLPLVRAANSGISGIVDSHGRVVDSLSLGTAGIIDGNIPKAVALTLYTRVGDWLFWGFLLILMAIASLARGGCRVQRIDINQEDVLSRPAMSDKTPTR